MTDVLSMTQAEASEIRTRNQKLLEKYMGSEGMAWWQAGAIEAGWFADDFVFHIPNAPPGISVSYTGYDWHEFFKYLNVVIKRFDLTWKKIYATVDPYAFWMEYYGEGEFSFGEGGHSEDLKVAFVRFDEKGRLKRYVENFDPTHIWRTAGVPIPKYDYNEDRLRNGLELHIQSPDTYNVRDYIERRRVQDPIDEAAVDLKGMSDREIGEIRDRNRMLLAKYMGSEGLSWWESGASEAGYFAEDYTFELPYAWPSYPLTCGPGDWQKLMAWINRIVMRFDLVWHRFYDMADPYTFWQDFYGEGITTGGQGGPYKQHEFTFIRLDENGRLRRYREHFNPMRSFESAGVWKPRTFDYNEDRKRNGLNAHIMVENTLDDFGKLQAQEVI